MPGETPEDLEARRAANEKVIQAAIKASLAAAFPLPTEDEAIVSTAAPSPALGTRKIYEMSDYAGLAAAANDRMDRFEHSLELMSGEISKVAGLVSKVSEKVDERFNLSIREADQRATTLVNATRTDISKFSTPITLVGTVMLFLIGGFASYVELGVGRDFDRLEKSIVSLSDVFAKRADKVDDRFSRLVDATVPRREADNRFERDETVLTHKVDKDVFAKTTEYRDDQIASLRADVTMLRSNTVARADIDGRFADLVKRLDLISNRVEQLQQTSAGTAILQEQLREAQAQISEVRQQLWPSRPSGGVVRQGP